MADVELAAHESDRSDDSGAGSESESNPTPRNVEFEPGQEGHNGDEGDVGPSLKHKQYTERFLDEDGVFIQLIVKSHWIDAPDWKFTPILKSHFIHAISKTRTYHWWIIIISVLWFLFAFLVMTADFPDWFLGVYIAFCWIYIVTVIPVELTVIDRTLMRRLAGRFEFWFIGCLWWFSITFLTIDYARGLEEAEAVARILGTDLVVLFGSFWMISLDAQYKDGMVKLVQRSVIFGGVVLFLIQRQIVWRVLGDSGESLEICAGRVCSTARDWIILPCFSTLLIFYIKYFYISLRFPDRLLLLHTSCRLVNTHGQIVPPTEGYDKIA